MKRRTSVLAFAFLLCSLSVPAFGADWYVDAVHGSDQNTGTSWEDAWKTISHAMHNVHGPDPVHLAPGIYDASNGEVFPIEISGMPILIGEGGQESTIIDGGGMDVTLLHCVGLLDMSGVTLRNAGWALLCELSLFDGILELRGTLEDVSVSGMGIGVGLVALGYFEHVDSRLVMTIEMRRTRMEDCETAAYAYAWTDKIFGSATSEIIADDCTFTRGSTGVLLQGDDDEGHASASLARCRFTQCDVGVWVNQRADARVEDSLFVENSSGIRFAGSLRVARSTIASNAWGMQGAQGRLDELSATIVYGNGDDIDLGHSSVGEVSYCDIGDGDFAGRNGNISADPLFVDPPGGDWRLRFGSPCVDTGMPECEESTDLVGTVRPVDGDLDAIEDCDMGAIEFRPLALVGEPRIGSAITFELWGPAGGSSDLWLARSPLLDPPQHTPFGEYDLNTHWDFLYASAPCAPGPPGTIVIQIPDVPALVGHSVGFQALTDSGITDPPYAWSNPIQLVFLPEHPSP